MNVTKGLIIDEPWIGYILSGEKSWEMRSMRTSFRGWFSLIRKGSGTVVGVARLSEVGAPLNHDEMVAAFAKHRIPEAMIRSGAVAKWNTPWILADARPLPAPVPYHHPFGAVMWVDLEPAVTAAIAGQVDLVAPAAISDASAVRGPSAKPRAAAAQVLAAPLRKSEPVSGRARAASGMWGEVELTEGNIRNNHFYMRSFLQRFPGDLIGGSNRSQAAPRMALVDWGGPAPVETDIDGDKQFFRARGWIRQFFADHSARPGDVVRVEETAPYRYRVSLRKR